MSELQRVRAEHEASILEFELTNRSYFAASISDRGDDYFQNFALEHRTLLAEQDTGGIACYVLIDEDESVVGRFNLYDIADGSANVGYRIAQRVAGRGVATSGLKGLCTVAREELGLSVLRASTRSENAASQRVLTKVGFVPAGATEVAGRAGLLFELRLEYS
jgi:ribosomal-protein-alanine N-acetyltransferase